MSIRPEDDGGFFCSAQNPAGTARANFTVRVVESFEESGSAGTSGGLQENTEIYNPEQDDMFKVSIKYYLKGGIPPRKYYTTVSKL